MLIGLFAVFLHPRYFARKHEPVRLNSPYERNFTQAVDHFTPSDFRTFENRYFINEEFYLAGVSDVLVLDIGGEAANSESSVTGSYSSYYFAQQMGGLLASLEHRFYGTSNFEQQQGDLQYLTASQAIADYSAFIPFLKAKYNVSKVLAVGGSYSASIATWLRSQLPHLVDAALASSGPLRAEQDFTKYLAHVQQQLSQPAQEVLGATYRYIEALIENDDFEEICQVFGISNCTFATDLDKTTLAEALVDPVAGVVQYSKAAKWDGEQERSDVEIFSDRLEICQTPQEAMTILAEFSDLSGFLHYDEMIESFQRPGENNGRLWYYQTCREFGFFQSARFDGSVFPQRIDVDYFLQICLDAFYAPMGLVNAGDLETARDLHHSVVSAANFQYFGALNVPRDHIYYTSGAVDPWTELAMSEQGWDLGQFRAKETANDVIEYGSHCSDLYLSWKLNEQLRAKQLEIFKRWMGFEE